MSTTTTSAPASAIGPKTKLRGRIVKTTLAGAIVDVGMDLPGVLHISQIQKEPINKVEDALHEGQNVDVWVRRVKKDRVELTMIEPLALEWRELQPQMVVKGKVVRLESYGAFVNIGAERPGLIHVSEIARGFVKNPGQVVKEGDEVEVMVLEVNRRKKQIRLSMKALVPKTEKPKPPKETRKERGKRARRKASEEAPATPSEPELTAMQIAWQEAIERAQSRRDREHLPTGG